MLQKKNWDVNNLFGQVILQKLLVNNFEWIEVTSQFSEDFIKNYNEESNEGHFLEDDLQYPEKLHDLCNDLPFSPERITEEKVEKLIANLHDKTQFVIHIKNLKEALTRGLVLKKLHGIIKFNQNACLNLYHDMNTDLIKKPKNDLHV